MSKELNEILNDELLDNEIIDRKNVVTENGVKGEVTFMYWNNLQDYDITFTFKYGSVNIYTGKDKELADIIFNSIQ